MKKTLRLGLVGTGIAARRLYWPALKKLKGKVELVAVANRTRSKAEAFARDHGVPLVAADAKALFALPGIDAVMLSLPIDQQPKLVLQALRAGKPVLSEKPVAGDIKQGRALVKAAAKFRRPWLVGENYRFMAHAHKAEAWLAAGKLGDLRRVEVRQGNILDTRVPYYHTAWRRDARFVGGFVLDAGVHLAHLLRRWLGMPREIQSLSAGFNPSLKPIDTTVAVLRFKSGVLGSWTSCFSSTVGGPAISLRGSKADLELYHQHCVLKPHGKAAVEYHAPDIGFEGQFLHFADVVLRGAPLAYQPAEALADLALMQGIVQGRVLRP